MSLSTQQLRQLWPFNDIEPREVQLEALAAGFERKGFAYFMRQRLGKTWTAFAEYAILREQGKVDWCVIICPNSLKLQWKEAVEQADEYIPVCVYSSNKKKQTAHYFRMNKRGGVFIINYESMKAFNDEFTNHPMFDPNRTYIIADESTKIKDPSSKMAKGSLALASQCAYRRVLTGKPRANSNGDLWSQLKFIDATNMSYYQHRHFFCMPTGYMGRTFVDQNTSILKAQMAPFSYIAPDKYLKGFKKVYEPMRRVNLTGELKDMYKSMEDNLVLQLTSDKADEVKITAPIILTQYLRLQQIASGLAGDTDGQQHNLVDPIYNPRIRVVRDIMDNEIDNQVIIICRFRLSIKNLYDELSRDGHKISVVNGMMAPNQLEHQKRMFNEGYHNVLIAQLQVLSYGHTLPGPDSRPCDSMIFYENDFSIINRAQCESRPEKMERDVPISYYDMFSSKMDRYIIQRLLDKEEASMAIMGYAREYGFRPNGLVEKDEDC